MKTIRVLSIIDLCLILFCFGFMIGTLIKSNYNMFYYSGSLLVAFLIIGVVLKTVQKKRNPIEEIEEPAEENKEN